MFFQIKTSFFNKKEFSFHLCIITACATTTCVSGLKRCRWWIWLGDQSRKGAAKRRGVPIFNTSERAWLKDTSPRKNRTGPRDIATSEILEGGSLAMSFMRRRWPLQAGLTRRSSWFFVAGCSLLRLSHYSCQAASARETTLLQSARTWECITVRFGRLVFSGSGQAFSGSSIA